MKRSQLPKNFRRPKPLAFCRPFDAVVETVKADEKLTLVGFGTFKLQARPARTGHNPSTGAPIKIAATNVPKFIPGAAFKAAVNAPKKKAPARKAKARK